MQDGHKQCSKCGEVKPVGDFSPSKSSKLGVKAQCKKCLAGEARAYYAMHREARIAYQKSYKDENKEKVIERRKAYRLANKEFLSTKAKVRREANKETHLARNREYRRANKEAILARQRVGYHANKERNLPKRKAYHLKNAAKLNAKRRAWYYANKKKHAVTRKAYYETHKESLNAYRKEHYRVNRERYRAQQKTWNASPIGRASKASSFHKRRSRGQFAFDVLATARHFRHWMQHGAICYLTGASLSPSAVTLDHVVPLQFGGTHDMWNIQPCSKSANSIKHDRLVYFDIATREARFTLDPCPGGPTWAQIPLTKPSLDDMQKMVDAWKARKERSLQDAA